MAFRVLDATSFYAGIPFSSPDVSYTTPLVFEEIQHIKRSHGAIAALVETGRLKIVEPDQRFTQLVLKKAEETGDYQSLSEGDVSVIALCLQLGGELLTDDFAVSNVAKHMSLTVFPIKTVGASKKRWVYLCTACNQSFSKASACPYCGNRLRRRPAGEKNFSKT